MGDPERRAVSSLAAQHWDVLVIGGGIVGAGVFRESARAGLRVLLLEQGDFASGTSSRSSKLVHGGLHYLAKGQIRLSLRSQHARSRLLTEGHGLVRPLRFELSPEVADRLPTWVRSAFLRLYQRGTSPTDAGPHAVRSHLGFIDGQTDDARLVLRVLREGGDRGGIALNYARVEQVLEDRTGRAVAALVTDRTTGRRSVLHARTVVSAIGHWSHRAGSLPSRGCRTRGLRGSHLVLPRHRLPVTHAVASIHRGSGRPVYALPWGPVTLVGSTSVPHALGPDSEPRISGEELDHLLSWARTAFPGYGLRFEDIQSTFAGIRAIPDRRAGERIAHASREEHIETAPGRVQVMGGKLTTFHTTARRVLRLILRDRGHAHAPYATPPLDPLPEPWPGLPFDDGEATRLMAFYGTAALERIAGAPAEERMPLPGFGATRAEVKWVCAMEHVRHLQDLLCRRFRVAIRAPSGGLPWVSRLRGVVCPALGWSAARWEEEVDAYRNYWRFAFAPPPLPASSFRRRAAGRREVAASV